MESVPTIRALDRLIVLIAWIAVILTGVYHLGLHATALTLNQPMGAWETTYVSIARAWPNQYQWEHFLDGHDGYGPGYPLFVRPFLLAGFDVYVAHRVANFVALLGACALIVQQLRRRGCSTRIVFAFTTIFYALNAGSYSIQARPDFLVLLEIAAMLVWGEAAASGRIRMGWSFALGFGMLGLAGFFTKAYAMFTWAAVLGYLALVVEWRSAVRAAWVGGVTIALGAWVYAARNPLYLMEVLGGQVVQAHPSFDWLRHQVVDFTLLACGVVGAAVLPFLMNARRSRTRTDDVTAPTSDAAGKYWRWQALLSCVALAVGPGWHTGAYLTYFLHWLLIPLVFVGASHFPRARTPDHRWFDLLLLANLTVLMVTAPHWPGTDANWAALRADMLQERGRVAADYLLEPIVQEKPTMILVGSGMTGYYLKEPFLIRNTTPTVLRARAASTAYVADQTKILFGGQPVDTVYLDCLLVGSEANRFALHPKNGMPFFTAPEMNNYVVAQVFHVCPYYFATNAPRQEAGVARTTIAKFVRKGSVAEPLATTTSGDFMIKQQGNREVQGRK